MKSMLTPLIILFLDSLMTSSLLQTKVKVFFQRLSFQVLKLSFTIHSPVASLITLIIKLLFPFAFDCHPFYLWKLSIVYFHFG